MNKKMTSNILRMKLFLSLWVCHVVAGTYFTRSDYTRPSSQLAKLLVGAYQHTPREISMEDKELELERRIAELFIMKSLANKDFADSDPPHESAALTNAITTRKRSKALDDLCGTTTMPGPWLISYCTQPIHDSRNPL